MYSQNTGGNYFDTQGSSAQVTTVVSSHSMVGTGGIQMGVTGGQLISSSGGTYLIGNSMENSGHSVTHTTRASPETVSILSFYFFNSASWWLLPYTFLFRYKKKKTLGWGKNVLRSFSMWLFLMYVKICAYRVKLGMLTHLWSYFTLNRRDTLGSTDKGHLDSDFHSGKGSTCHLSRP